MNGPEAQSQPFPEGDHMDAMEEKKKEVQALEVFDEKLANLKKFVAARLVKRPISKPTPAPVFDGKMAAAGVDKDDDELIDDGHGGLVMRKYAN